MQVAADPGKLATVTLMYLYGNRTQNPAVECYEMKPRCALEILTNP
jgi:hypothetical protein